VTRSRRTCPVCGCGYKGLLGDHLDLVKDHNDVGVSVTQCDWNLNTARIARDYQALLDAGYTRAEPVAAKVVAPMSDVQPRLALRATTGSPHNILAAWGMGRHKDATVWWCQRWVKALALVERWPMTIRRQLIREVDLHGPDMKSVVEAALVTGGGPGVAVLVLALLPRCQASEGDLRLARGVTAKADTCALAVDHAGIHVGARGVSWG
jgi:hypothetical protein